MKSAIGLTSTTIAIFAAFLLLVIGDSRAQVQAPAHPETPGAKCVNLVANIYTCLYAFADGTKCVTTGALGAGSSVCSFSAAPIPPDAPKLQAH
jgi:hypothetical protein